MVCPQCEHIYRIKDSIPNMVSRSPGSQALASHHTTHICSSSGTAAGGTRDSQVVAYNGTDGTNHHLTLPGIVALIFLDLLYFRSRSASHRKLHTTSCPVSGPVTLIERENSCSVRLFPFDETAGNGQIEASPGRVSADTPARCLRWSVCAPLLRSNCCLVQVASSA